MPITDIHECECQDCQGETQHPNRTHHQQINLLLSRLDEQQRRWYVALEADQIGHGGDCINVEDHGPRREDDPPRKSRDASGPC